MRIRRRRLPPSTPRASTGISHPSSYRAISDSRRVRSRTIPPSPPTFLSPFASPPPPAPARPLHSIIRIRRVFALRYGVTAASSSSYRIPVIVHRIAKWRATGRPIAGRQVIGRRSFGVTWGPVGPRQFGWPFHSPSPPRAPSPNESHVGLCALLLFQARARGRARRSSRYP